MLKKIRKRKSNKLSKNRNSNHRKCPNKRITKVRII